MTNIVIDTNIVISAALSPHANPSRIMAFIADDEET